MSSSTQQTDQAGLAPAFVQVEEIAGIISSYRDKVLDGEGKLDELDDKAVRLEMAATKFDTNPTKVKRKMWWENTKMKIFIGVSVFIIVIAIILLIIYGVGVLIPTMQVLNK